MISALNRILTRIASSWPGSSNGGSSIRICWPLSLSVHTLSGSISSGIVFTPHIPSLRRASQNGAARLCSFGDTGSTGLPARSAAFARRIQELVAKNCASAKVEHGGRRHGQAALSDRSLVSAWRLRRRHVDVQRPAANLRGVARPCRGVGRTLPYSCDALPSRAAATGRVPRLVSDAPGPAGRRSPLHLRRRKGALTPVA